LQVQEYDHSLSGRMERLSEGAGSPVEQMKAALKIAQDFDGPEIGLIHPHTRAGVKLRDDGGIDIFARDVGISIDPRSGTVNLFGLIQHHASSIHQYVADDMLTDVKRSWSVICEGSVQLEGRTVLVKSAKDLTVQSADTLHIHGAKDIAISGDQALTVHAKGALDVTSKGHLSVQTDGNLDLVAGGNVRVKAGGFIDLE
jgi:hypothetical protein